MTNSVNKVHQNMTPTKDVAANPFILPTPTSDGAHFPYSKSVAKSEVVGYIEKFLQEVEK